MTAFVYDGSVPGHASWRVAGRVFHGGIPVKVTEAQARKLRRLPFFLEAASLQEDTQPEGAIAAVVCEIPAPESGNVVPITRKRGRPPGSKNKVKVTNGHQDPR